MKIKKLRYRYLIYRRKSLRQRVREHSKWHNDLQVWTAHTRKGRALQTKYETLGKKWWKLHNEIYTGFGLDITDYPFSKIDVIEYIEDNQDVDFKRLQETPGTHEYNALRVLKDKSVKIDLFYYTAEREGESRQYCALIKNGELEIPSWMTEEQATALRTRYENRNNNASDS